MSGFTFRRLTVPSIAPQHVVIATSIVSRKIFRRSFHTPFKTWPTFCFNVCSKELWVLFIQRGDIWGRRRRTRREGGWQTSLSLLVWTKIATVTLEDFAAALMTMSWPVDHQISSWLPCCQKYCLDREEVTYIYAYQSSRKFK